MATEHHIHLTQYAIANEWYTINEYSYNHKIVLMCKMFSGFKCEKYGVLILGMEFFGSVEQCGFWQIGSSIHKIHDKRNACLPAAFKCTKR